MNVDDLQRFPLAFIRIHLGHPLDSRWEDYEMRKGFTRQPQRDEPATRVKNYITRGGLERLKDEHRFLLTRDRPAVAEVVAWAAGNGDRGKNADYQYGKRRLRQIDGGIAFSRSESKPRKWWTRKLRERGMRQRGHSSERPCAMPMLREQSEW